MVTERNFSGADGAITVQHPSAVYSRGNKCFQQIQEIG